MNLEDATKEELIWWIKKHAFELKYELRHFGPDVMFRRYQHFNDKAHSAGERYSKAFAEYSSILSPYKGLPIASIPRDVCKKGANLVSTMLQASKEQRRYWKAADKCLGKYDQMMEETTHG